MSWRELAAERLFDLKNTAVIDVRSPCEHEAENIPGSVNIPLLDNDERAQIGIIYAKEGEITARRRALTIIAPKIPAIVDEILSLGKGGSSLVVHCWRGGLRSETVASFLSVVGIDCWRLTGGYKAWRQVVLQDFKSFKSLKSFKDQAVVLYGQAGAGKTEILKELAKLGCSVIDLEGLAQHRGSVFGGMGLAWQPTQKNFEAQLWVRMRQILLQPQIQPQTQSQNAQNHVFLEGEGRKVGKIALPDFIYSGIEQGQRILVTDTQDSRTERIVKEYASSAHSDAIGEGMRLLSSLKQRLGHDCLRRLTDLVEGGDIRQAVQILLLQYYDPLYDKQIAGAERFDLVVSGQDPQAAACSIAQWSASQAVLETSSQIVEAQRLGAQTVARPG